MTGSAGFTPAPPVPIAPPIVEGAALARRCSVVLLLRHHFKIAAWSLTFPQRMALICRRDAPLVSSPSRPSQASPALEASPPPPPPSRRAINITDITRLSKRAELNVRIRNRWEKDREEILVKVLSFLFTLLLWRLFAVCSLHKNKAIKMTLGAAS